MASGVLGLLDDIATLMDDVASMAKIATKKTVGILADDLAVNAEKASGFLSTRELPVLWKLTKGSLLNKVIILPAVFLLSAFLPIAIVPILLLGGTYLSFEGALKIYEFLFHRGDKKRARKLSEMSNSELEGYEKKKIKSAVLIDFILSIEIIIIALGTVIDEPLKIQIPVVTFVAILATIAVYGVVALLVRVDDTGYRLIALNKSDFANKLGRLLVRTLPIIIRVLNVVGTLAMLLVGGGIFVHNVQIIHHYFHDIPMILAELTVGLVSGIVFLTIYLLIKKITSVKA
jgi:predicted DNA repair protein MutK